MKRRTALIILVHVLGLLIANACASIPGKRVNPVEQAGLGQTVKIEVVELNTWKPGDEPYVHRLTISDTEVLDELVSALDTGLRVALKVQCIPEYELRFHLQDDTVQTFGYNCHGATFIRGEQDFWEEEDYDPPEQFDALLQEQLAATAPSEVNVVVEAELTQTVRIEPFETVTEAVSPEAAGTPAVVQAQVLHRLTVTDPEIVAQVVGTLDAVVPLGPRARAATPYVLQFHLEDGTMRSLGYARAGEQPAVLRVDQLRCFKRQDARPPAQFEALVIELLAAAAEGP